MRARTLYLLDLDVIAELSRPDGNRQVFTLFLQQQAQCAVPAAVVYALARGVEALPSGPRKNQLARFAHELFVSGPPAVSFDRDAALWLAAAKSREPRIAGVWSSFQGQLAATAATQERVLVTRSVPLYAGVQGLTLADWFRP